MAMKRGNDRSSRSTTTALIVVATAVAVVAGCTAATGSGMPSVDGSVNSSGGSQGSGSGGVTAGGSGGSLGSGGSSPVGSGGASSSGSGGTSGGTGGAVGIPTCNVRIVPVAPPAFFDVPAGPSLKFRARGVVTNTMATMPTWTWQVRLDTLMNAPLMDITTVSVDVTGSVIEFPIVRPGNYQIVARVSDSKCPSASEVAYVIQAKPSFIFRTAAAGFPVQDITKPAFDSPSTLELDPGTSYTIRVRRADQSTALPAYLRFSSPTTAFRLEKDTTHGDVTAKLIRLVTYDLLVVPSDPTFAPDLLTALPADWAFGIRLEQGVQVPTLILDPSGMPVVGARMLLKRGDLTSTVGVSDESGMLDLWTRPGNMSAIVIPPDGAGLPQANVEVTATETGVVIPSSTSSLKLTMRWNATARGRLTITVRGLGGNGTLPGARVRIWARAAATPIGMLTTTALGAPSATIPTYGSHDGEGLSDASGTATFTALPVGTYDVTIIPPAGMTTAAVTTTSVTVTAAGVVRSVTLAPKASLTGTLAPLPAAAGASVTAIDKSRDATSGAVSAIADQTGAFVLSVDPDRSYQLVVQPLPGQALARTVLPNVTVTAAGKSIGTVTLARALTFTGKVTSGGALIDAAFIQAFCAASSATCVDPTVSLGEARSSSDGYFEMVLSDPSAPP